VHAVNALLAILGLVLILQRSAHGSVLRGAGSVDGNDRHDRQDASEFEQGVTIVRGFPRVELIESRSGMVLLSVFGKA
jgi:hypothetical protein